MEVNMKLSLITGVAILLGLLFIACDGEEEDGGEGIVLRNDSGVFITLEPGEEFDVVLEANPSTGYRWEIDPEIDGVELVEVVGEPSFVSQSDLPGSGGKTTFTFSALEEGSGFLKLKFWRSFEPEAEPLRYFEVHIAIEAD